MTNSMIPYSFTPGTKARAQEVNANFNALADKIEENNSTALHTESNATITGDITFSKAIKSSGKYHDTQGNLTILNIADGEYCDAILGRTDKNKNCASIRITNANGYNIIEFGSYNEDGSAKLSMGLRNTNGVSYAFAPTYTGNYADSSDRIVTTAYMANHWVTAAAGTSSTATKTRPAVVVTNYRNGTTWYRVWSDGWIEQGAKVSPTFSAYFATVTFPKAFTNTNYTFLATGQSADAAYYQSDSVNASQNTSLKTTSSIQISSDAARTFYYYACGY